MECRLWDAGKLRVVGVDEAGVGPLAGPVVAAACLISPRCQTIDGVRDSKLLTPARREQLYQEIVRQAVAIGVGAASVREIDRLNVLRASHLAMRRALARVGGYDHALVDGRPIRDADLGPHTTVVDGDASSYAIACASIVAKVTRDRLMRKLAARYPVYGWDHNAGYCTREHVEAIRTHGTCAHHRQLFVASALSHYPPGRG